MRRRILPVLFCTLLIVSQLPRFSPKREGAGRAVGYTVVANAVSFAAGLGIAHLIPRIF